MGRSPGEVTPRRYSESGRGTARKTASRARVPQIHGVIGEVVIPALDEAEDTMSRALRAVTIASMVNKARAGGFGPSE